MKVEKAGCILINKKNNKIGLIYRQKQKDYSFPKGHRESEESLIECAIRETAEETKRDCILYSNEPVAQEHYYDSKNDECIYIGKFLNAISTLNKDGALRLIYQNKDFEIKYIDPGLNNKYIYGIFKLKHLVL